MVLLVSTREAWRREEENSVIVFCKVWIASWIGRFISRCQERPRATSAVERFGMVLMYCFCC